jgi:hypothetical protein
MYIRAKDIRAQDTRTQDVRTQDLRVPDIRSPDIRARSVECETLESGHERPATSQRPELLHGHSAGHKSADNVSVKEWRRFEGQL